MALRASALPLTSTPVLGRAGALAELARLLDADAAFVTLVGPPGIGKTRLALEAAAEWATRTARPVVFVDLSAASDEAGVVAASLSACGLAAGEKAGFDEDLGRLADALDEGRALVVVDNAEHVVAAASALVTRCRAVRGATFLVTSREALGDDEERRFEVGPLRDEDAAALFLDRAARLAPTLSFDAGEHEAVREIVGRLERLPLAIELAAGRTPLARPTAIARLLARSVDVLAGSGAGPPSRHASLDEAVAWSYDLLGEGERAALRACSVFDGGFVTEAAVAVVAGDDAFASLASLRDKSLLRADASGASTRLYLYATVRAFAARALARAPEHDAVVARYAAYAEAFARGLGAPDDPRRGRADASDVLNLLGAAACVTALDPARAARILVAAAPALAATFPVEARLAWLDRAVAAAERAADPPLLYRALVARAGASIAAARLPAARADAVRILAAPDADDESYGESETLLASVAVDQMRLTDAVAHAERAVARLRNGSARAKALRVLGWTRMQLVDIPGAEAALTEALAASQAAQDRATEAEVLTSLGDLAQVAGRVTDAIELHDAATSVARQAGHRQREALALANGAYALCEVRAFDRVVERSLASAEIARELGDRRLEVLSLAALSFALQGCGRLDDALDVATRAIGLPAGDYVSVVARVCHAALIAERGAVARAGATFDALEAATRGSPSHPLRAVLSLARLFCDLGVALAAARAGDLASATRHVEVLRASSLAPPGLEHPDVRLWRVFLAHALVRNAATLGASTCVLEVDADGAWLRRDEGPRVACGQRPVLRRLLGTLAAARVESPGRALSPGELTAAGWPGEKMTAASARRRLQVAVSRLRELGLTGVLENEAGGYRLAPAATVRFVRRDV